MQTVIVETEKSILELLAEISGVVLRLDDFHESLDYIVKQTTRELGASSGSLAVYSRDTENLKIISSYNHSMQEIERMNDNNLLQPGKGIAGRAFSTGEVIQTPNIRCSGEFMSVLPQACENYTSLLAVPLQVKDEKIGVLNFTFARQTVLSENNRYLLQIAGNYIAIAIRQSELTEKLQQKNEKLLQMAREDSLTGLPNHRRIHEILRQEFNRARRNKAHLTVAMVDIDYFKRINDTHGHPVGDLVLRKLAAIMDEEIRGHDRVGRYGGEEFLIVLPDTDIEAGFEALDRIRRKIESDGVIIGKRNISVTVSAGLTEAGPDNYPEKASSLVKIADRQLYAAKKAGRNNCYTG